MNPKTTQRLNYAAIIIGGLMLSVVLLNKALGLNAIKTCNWLHGQVIAALTCGVAIPALDTPKQNAQTTSDTSEKLLKNLN